MVIIHKSPLITHESINPSFNLRLGQALFSDPQCDRANAIVVANHEDLTADIKPLDLLRIDFTDNELAEGLYVITLDDGWIGYRFFDRLPALHMRDHLDSYLVTPVMLGSIKVIGKVKDIYRSSKKE